MGIFGWETTDRNDPYYKACLVSTTAGMAIIGAGMGSVAIPGLGTLAGWKGGGAVGFIGGYLACPYVAPGLRRKFDVGDAFTTVEVRQAAEAMASYAGVRDARQALKLVALVKIHARNASGGQMCHNPAMVAQRLLQA